MMFMSFNSDTRGVTSGASTGYTSRATKFTPAISGVRVQCYVFVVLPLYSLLLRYSGLVSSNLSYNTYIE